MIEQRLTFISPLDLKAEQELNTVEERVAEQQAALKIIVAITNGKLKAHHVRAVMRVVDTKVTESVCAAIPNQALPQLIAEKA
jgi:uncharacterized coiled-coil protein SlyX